MLAIKAFTILKTKDLILLQSTVFSRWNERNTTSDDEAACRYRYWISLSKVACWSSLQKKWSPLNAGLKHVHALTSIGLKVAEVWGPNFRRCSWVSSTEPGQPERLQNGWNRFCLCLCSDETLYIPHSVIYIYTIYMETIWTVYSPIVSIQSIFSCTS